MPRIVRAEHRGPAIMPRAMVAARDTARDIVERAERDASVIIQRAERDASVNIQRAERDASAIIQRAERDASAIAERARAEGLEAARAELAARVLELERARDAALTLLSAQTRDAARLAAEHVIAAELALAPERITAIVEEQLGRVRRARRAVLHVHPQDAAVLRAWLAAREAPAAIELVTDPALARGGCVVVSDIGSIDARIETRLVRLQEALERIAGPA